ncbi:ASN_HP2_G0026580.mRNA.1.CDS.1 [Saccharomyces cerevisiae]|nr:ASN_HP2_G0026580.mRNA.1.CDS.1 [Saccharomyces cerevisiae]CAI6792612.1 ASN_HP2_G0026580.mRNA.1.CDS.1 [Saccharomyces cerevisiae]
MKFMSCLVINHCSGKHEWFKGSRSSKPIQNVTGSSGDLLRVMMPKASAKFLQQLEVFISVVLPGRSLKDTSVFLALQKGNLRKCRWLWLDHGVDGCGIDVGSLYSKVAGLPDCSS